MFGLPVGTDLSFLIGRDLEQVCFGRHEVVLRFGDAVSISVESEMGYKSGCEPLVRYVDIISSAPALCSLLSSSITNAVPRSAGTLALEFSNGDVLEVYESNGESYESYRISHGEKMIVV
jgi:hypothetical protein